MHWSEHRLLREQKEMHIQVSCMKIKQHDHRTLFIKEFQWSWTENACLFNSEKETFFRLSYKHHCISQQSASFCLCAEVLSRPVADRRSAASWLKVCCRLHLLIITIFVGFAGSGAVLLPWLEPRKLFLHATRCLRLQHTHRVHQGRTELFPVLTACSPGCGLFSHLKEMSQRWATGMSVLSHQQRESAVSKTPQTIHKVQFVLMSVFMHIQNQNKQVLSQTRAKHDLNKWTACALQHSNSHFLEWLVRPQLNILSLATWGRIKEVSSSG